MDNILRLSMVPSDAAFDNAAECVLADIITDAVNNDLKEILPYTLTDMGIDTDKLTDHEYDENMCRLAEAMVRCLQKGVELRRF